MNTTNLMSPAYLRVLAERRRLGRWSVAVAVAGSVGIAACVGAWAARPTPAVDAVRELEYAEARLQSTRDRLEHLQRSATRLEREAAVAQAVAAYPDWSILLALLDAKRGDQVVLQSVAIARAPSPGRADTAAVTPNRAWRLVLRGLSTSHTAATAYALDLEAIGIFSGVAIKDAGMQARGEAMLVSFQIEAQLLDSALTARSVGGDR